MHSSCYVAKLDQMCPNGPINRLEHDQMCPNGGIDGLLAVVRELQGNRDVFGFAK